MPLMEFQEMGGVPNDDREIFQKLQTKIAFSDFKSSPIMISES